MVGQCVEALAKSEKENMTQKMKEEWNCLNKQRGIQQNLLLRKLLIIIFQHQGENSHEIVH